MKKILCWIIGGWRTITHLTPVSGCDYVEVDSPKGIQRLECTRCKAISDGHY